MIFGLLRTFTISKRFSTPLFPMELWKNGWSGYRFWILYITFTWKIIWKL